MREVVEFYLKRCIVFFFRSFKIMSGIIGWNDSSNFFEIKLGYGRGRFDFKS